MITGYFGLPRSGKTTCLARYIAKNYYKYDHLYISGETFNLSDNDFVTYIHPYEIGSFRPVDNSLFVLCEAGTFFNNRLISKIPSYCTDFFALHGHYHCDIIWDSQSVDVDKKLRDRTSRLYLVKKSFIPCFSHVTSIGHAIGVNPETNDLQEVYTIPDGLIKRLVAMLTFRSFWFFRPRYYSIFDSFSDVLFHGDPVLPKQIVFDLCPQKYLSQLFYYLKVCDDYEKSKKAVQQVKPCN